VAARPEAVQEPEYARRFLGDALLRKRVVGTGVELRQVARPFAEACARVAEREPAGRERAFYACLSDLFAALEAAARELVDLYAGEPAEQARRAVREAAKRGRFALVVDGVGKSLGELALPLMEACARSPRTLERGSASAALVCAADIAKLLRVRAEELGGAR
jgi:hypothetical protein